MNVLTCAQHAQRLASSRECSTSYPGTCRAGRACGAAVRHAHARAPPRWRSRPVAFAGKDAAAFYPPDDRGLPGPGPGPGAEPSGDRAATPKGDAPKALSKSGLPRVPWGLDKVFQVMTLWLLAYIMIGQVAVPLVLSVLGVDRPELTVRSHAVLHLCLDVSQLLITLSILWSCLRRYRPRALGLFPLHVRGPWLLDVAVSCISFPVVDWLAHQNMGWFPNASDATWAINLEHSFSAGDWITNVAYFSVVSLCAPIWEEAIFRGFLLTSLARYMPAPYAVAASSGVFAMCHFRLQTFLPLLVLGVVFAALFIRTRNLLPPILLHSAWNLYVLVSLVLRPG